MTGHPHHRASLFPWPELAAATLPVLFLLLSSGCTRTSMQGSSGEKLTPDPQAYRILLDQAPQTLNPRMAIDAIGQRLGTLVFSGLTRINQDLAVVPDLAESWSVGDQGRLWRFRVREGMKDHEGKPISVASLVECLENYRTGKPVSRIRAAFPFWVSTKMQGQFVEIQLEKPDAYFPRNLSSLRYFRVQGLKGACVDPSFAAPGSPWIGSGPYFVPPNLTQSDQQEFDFRPAQERYTPLRFLVVRDELQRVIRLLRGEADVAQNSISLTRTRWLLREYPDKFNIIERPGVNVSYIAFNLRDPILSKLAVREALARAVPRESFVRNKMAGFGVLAGSLLSPLLPESYSVPFEENAARAEELLDQAGWKRGRDGVRFRLKYRTTPVRDGFETALVLQEAWKKIGVVLELDVVEPAAFLSGIRNGAFQLYSSRWVGVADGSILHRTMRSGTSNNRVGYRDSEADALLDALTATVELDQRKPTAQMLQKKMMADLPYFPLWYWGNAVVIRKDRDPGLRSEEISMSGAFEPLAAALSKKRFDGPAPGFPKEKQSL